MELSRILWSAAVVVLLAGCSSADESPADIPPAKSGKITIRTGFDEGQGTRISFTQQGETAVGLKVAWQSSDRLMVAPQGSADVATFNAGAISADGHKAEFSGTFTPPISQTTTMRAMVGTPAIDVTGGVATLDFAEQTGRLEDLSRYDLITGTTVYNPAAGDNMDIGMKHEMAFIKGTIILPFTPDETELTVTLKADGMVNSMGWSLADGSFTDAGTGDITLTAARVDGTRLTFYAAVKPGVLVNLLAAVTSSAGAVISDLVMTDRFTVEAGKLYTVTRSDQPLDDVTLWTGNQAWSKVYEAANYKLATVERIPQEGTEWLTVTSDGTRVTVSATANTTGAPRQGKIVFGNGSQTTTVDITQIEESDFAGNWDMTAFKVFYTTGFNKLETYDAGWTGVGTTAPNTDMKIYDGSDYGNRQELMLVNKPGKTVTAWECLTEKQLTATNNLCMTGLYENLQTEALSRVDHNARTATVSIFFDTNASQTKAQRLYTGQYAGQYAALMPELSKGIATGWDFHYATIGGCQYAWYVGKVTVAGHTTTVRWSANTSGMQRLKTGTASPTLRICGLQVMRYMSSTIDYLNMIRQQNNTTSNAAYAITYQGDILMRRTADGYKDIIVGGDN